MITLNITVSQNTNLNELFEKSSTGNHLISDLANASSNSFLELYKLPEAGERDIYNPSAQDDGPKFEIYPNPSTGMVYINRTNARQTAPFDLTLLDIDGKILLSRKALLNGLNDEIDLSKFPAGIYYLKLKSGENLYTEKIIINE